MIDDVSLRFVEAGDLPVFFIHQQDPEACRMAAFPPRERERFFSHWESILRDPAVSNRTILLGNVVVGNVGAWTNAETKERLLCYWIGREFWGRGIATRAVTAFLHAEPTRPLRARVARHNAGSIRVLERTGFLCTGEDAYVSHDGSPVAEFIYTLST